MIYYGGAGLLPKTRTEFVPKPAEGYGGEGIKESCMEVACCFLSRAFRKREIIWFREKDTLCASTATIPTTLFSLAYILAPYNIRTVWCEVGQ